MSDTSYHHGNLKQALIQAADTVLRDKGLQGFTLRECARRAEVSHAAPKHHFGDVRGLLTAVAAQGFSRLRERLNGALANASGDLTAEFAATAQAYGDFAQAYPEHFRVMFRSDLLNTSDPQLQEEMAQTYSVMTNVIRRQRGESEILATDLADEERASSELLSDILIAWSFIHGYAHLHLEQQLDMMAPQIRQLVRDQASTRLSKLISGG